MSADGTDRTNDEGGAAGEDLPALNGPVFEEVFKSSNFASIPGFAVEM